MASYGYFGTGLLQLSMITKRLHLVTGVWSEDFSPNGVGSGIPELWR